MLRALRAPSRKSKERLVWWAVAVTIGGSALVPPNVYNGFLFTDNDGTEQVHDDVSQSTTQLQYVTDESVQRKF